MPSYPHQPRIWVSDLSWDTDKVRVWLLPYETSEEDLDLIHSVMDDVASLPEALDGM